MNYPGGKRKSKRQKKPQGGGSRKGEKRGQLLESAIEQANTMYQLRRLALIQKVPTPTKNIKGRIIYEQKSTVDFIGTLRGGRAVHFDAKQTANKTNYPLDKISDHQMEWLIQQHDLGAAAFFVIHFSSRGKTFLLPVKEAAEWKQQAIKGRKSIPFEAFVHPVPAAGGIAIDYLSAWEVYESHVDSTEL